MVVKIEGSKLFIEMDLQDPTPSARQRGHGGNGQREAGHHRAECLYQGVGNGGDAEEVPRGDSGHRSRFRVGNRIGAPAPRGGP